MLIIITIHFYNWKYNLAYLYFGIVLGQLIQIVLWQDCASDRDDQL